MQNSIEKLEKLASELAKLDENIIEVFIHAKKPLDPLKEEEVYLVCLLADPQMTNDLDYHNEEGFNWSVEISERLSPLIQKLGIQSEIVVTPFNRQLYEDGEYGEYYRTLFIKKDHTPILELLDEQE